MKIELKDIISYLNKNIKNYYLEISKITLTRWQYIYGFGDKTKLFFNIYKFKITDNIGIILHTNKDLEQSFLEGLEKNLKEAFKWLDIQNGQTLDIEKLRKMLKEVESSLNLQEK